MKVKTLLKAAASAAVGALMLGSTLSGAALAQNLGDLPAPFVQDGSMNSIFVVGSQGSDPAGLASDVAGAIEVAAAMGQATIKETTATAAGGSVTIEQAGGEGMTEEVHLGQRLAKLGSASQFKPTLKHDDIAVIKETPSTSKIQGDDGSTYDFEEMLELSTTQGTVDMYEGWIGLDIPDATVMYKLEFEDSIDGDGNTATINCATDDDDAFPLDNIMFLGRELEIECSDFDGTMTVSMGTEYRLTQGQTITHGDYEISLTGLDTRSGVQQAGFSITKGGNSDSTALEEGEIETILGLSIECKDTFQTGAGSQATIVVGDTLEDTVTEGDDFGTEEDWNWIIDKGTDSKPIIGIEYEAEGDSLTGEDMLQEDESLSLPGDVLQIQHQGFENSNIGDLSIDSKSSTTVYAGGTEMNNQAALEIDFMDEQGERTDDFQISTVDDAPVNASSTTLQSAEALRLYVDGSANAHITYRDTADSSWEQGANYTGIANAAGATFALLRYETSLIYFTANDTALTLSVRDPVNTATEIEKIVRYFETNSTNNQLEDDTTGNALFYQYGTGSADKADWYSGAKSSNDDGFITQWGIEIGNPENDVEDRSLNLDIPDDRQTVEVFIGSGAGTSETELGVGDEVCDGTTIKSISAAGASSMEVVPISAPIAKTDSEVSDTEKTSTNLLLFGGPSVNMLVEELGIQASEFQDADGNPIGKIKLVSGAFGGSYTAAVVAGWDAINTRMASYVMAHYDDYASTFAGKSEVTVEGTTTSALTVA